MRACLHRYVNQHSATYIVLLSAYKVVDVNDKNAFPNRLMSIASRFVKKKQDDNQTSKMSIFGSYHLHWITRWLCSVRHPSVLSVLLFVRLKSERYAIFVLM